MIVSIKNKEIKWKGGDSKPILPYHVFLIYMSSFSQSGLNITKISSYPGNVT